MSHHDWCLLSMAVTYVVFFGAGFYLGLRAGEVPRRW